MVVMENGSSEQQVENKEYNPYILKRIEEINNDFDILFNSIKAFKTMLIFCSLLLIYVFIYSIVKLYGI